MKLCDCGCGKEVTNEKNRFLSGHSNRGRKDIYLKRGQRFLELHGVRNPSQLSEVKEKKIETNKRNRNCNNPMQCVDVQKKCEETMMKKYNSRFIFTSEYFRKKYEYIMMRSYGVRNSMQVEEFKEKQQRTMENRYHKKNASQILEFQNKKVQTSIKNWNSDYPMQCIEIQVKSQITNKERYGGPAPYCSKEIREKGKITCIQNHNVDNYSKTPEFREFARGQMINAVSAGLKDGEKFTPRKGNNELPFINELRKHTSYFIDNDARVINYFPDGYIKELKLIIEFDEPFHGGKYYKERDYQKDEDYKKTGLLIFRVKEKNWLENKEKVILDFKEVLQCLST